ncbi:hypothetical protein V7O61_08610 [Methanolobus sp. WCC1]|jgi:hypothetical protein|uniref:hypothetical protein n=1 Tax=unclassified Methanolobus TaxID=2629569 RepID=UPI003244AEC8
MRKELPLIIAGIILVSAIIWWHYDSSVDVKIVEINAPRTLGVDTIRTDSMNEIELVIQNNESKNVEVKIETENAFVDENGKSADTFIVFGYNGYHYSDYISTQDKISLEPGENRLTLLLGYQVTGEQNVHIRIVNNEVVLDEESFTVDVLPPELSVELNYELESIGELNIYNIDAYVINSGLGRAENVETTISIIDPDTKEVMSSENNNFDVPAYSKSSFSTWKDSHAGVIELSSGENSDESYMPAQAVVKEKIGKQYIVKVTAVWKEQIAEKEIIVPENSSVLEVEL